MKTTPFLRILLLRHMALLLLSCLMLTSCVKKVTDPPPVTYPDYHRQKLGASAKDLLGSERFSSLTVEIHYMPSFRPQPETLDSLQSFLQTHLNKPGGITVVMKEIPPAGKQALSKEGVLKVENKERSLFPLNRNLTIYVLVTDGTQTDRNILGMAYRNTSVVLFGKAIGSNSGGHNVLTRAELETSVLLHEMGHLLGLGGPAQAAFSRRTTRSKNHHCENELCLMYWATETRKLSVINRKGKIPRLDEDCRQVLLESGGKVPVVPLQDSTSFFKRF